MKKKIGKIIIRWIFLIFCGTIIGFNIYNMNASQLLGNRLPMPFGYGLGTVLTGSMEPEISEGDLIIVKEIDELKVGDIVVFEDDNSLVVHRIIEIEGDSLVTKGDANNTADEPITLSLVRGKVVVWVPYVGMIVEFIKTPIGIVIVLALALLLVEVPRQREKKKDEEELNKIKEEIRRLKDTPADREHI